MLTKKYYSKFAKIFRKEIAFNKSLYQQQKAINFRQFRARMRIIERILAGFISFMEQDNSQFDKNRFRKACGL